jgi:HK97 gp10 family phage protein
VDDVTVKIHGLDELQQALEELPYKVAKKGLRAALAEGAAPIQEAMVNLAPHDTGFLAEHFNVKFKMRSDSLAGSAFIGPQGKIDYPAYVSGAYHIVRNKAGKVVKKVGKIAVATVARFLEFGTHKMAKKPFMTQAYETEKEQALARITERLALAVAEAASEAPKGPKA